MFYVYILYSEGYDKFYVGQTNNPDQRFRRHNAGFVRSTAPYLPWKPICVVEKTTRSEAMILEKKLKNLSKARIKKFAEKYGNEF